MTHYKRFENGFRLVVNKIDGLLSVTAGVVVKTGSANESDKENGISHFIEHTVFKGTESMSSFEISDYIDGIGAQINAFTSKETTCYYTKSTSDHFEDSVKVLSDIFFNATFDEAELEKEKGVIVEEINMSEDTPEDLCLDLLSESYYGKEGYGRTILGPSENVRRFSRADVFSYMDKYYTADNVILSVAGNVDVKEAEKVAEKYFAQNFKRLKCAPQVSGGRKSKTSLFKSKKIEQAHIGFIMPALPVTDRRTDALGIANTVLGGGMSSKLFQKVREEMGLAYSVYSYNSHYKDHGVTEIYAGVNLNQRDIAAEEIEKTVKEFKKTGVSEKEFLRGKEQLKSSLVLSQENTASQMILFAKYLLFKNEIFDFGRKVKSVEDIKIEEVNALIEEFFDIENASKSTVGQAKTPLLV